jgi:hypothetical protein
VVVHIFVARFAVGFACECDIGAVGKKLEELVAQGFIVEREESPRTQPGALEGDEVDIEIAAFGERSALRLCETREAFVFLRAGGDGRADFIGGVRIRGAQAGLMHFHVPLQVRIFVHLAGSGRSFQFEAADDGDHFLAVGDAQARFGGRHGDGLGGDEIVGGEECAAGGACGRGVPFRQ